MDSAHTHPAEAVPAVQKSVLAKAALIAVLFMCGCAGGISPAPALPALIAPSGIDEVAMQPGQSWEANSVMEPSVLRGPDGIYRMWYTGNWGAGAMGFATSPDGLHWEKNPDNPIIGNGRAGIAAAAAQNSVTFDNGTYYIYFVNLGNISVATSADGLHVNVNPVAALPRPSWSLQAANSFTWKEGGKVHMIYEGLAFDGVWRMGLAVADSFLGPFIEQGGPLQGLAHSDGSFGGPWLASGGMFYHAAQHGFGPTDIFFSQSADFVNWSTPQLIQSHAEPFDQAADPSMAGRLLYFAEVDNPKETSRIRVKSF